MAAPTVGTVGAVLTPASGSSAAIAVPAGTAADQIVFVFLYKEISATVTMPSGFAEITPGPPVTTGSVHQNHIFWKRLTAADSGTYTFSWTGAAWRTGYAVRIPGAILTGTPFEAHVAASRSSAGTVSPAVQTTTLGPERLVLFSVMDFSAGTWSAGPSGFTENADTNTEAGALYSATFATAQTSASLTATATASAAQSARVFAVIPIPTTTDVAGTDTATVADAGDLATDLTGADTSALTDTGAATADVSTTDTAALAEAPAIGVSDVDTSTLAEMGQGGPGDTDTATLAEAASLFVTVAGADTVTAVEILDRAARLVPVDTVEVVVEVADLSGGGLAPRPAEVVVEVQETPTGIGGDPFSASARGFPARYTPKAARLIAQNILTGEWLSWELPVTDPEITWDLSGPTTISGVFKPEMRSIADLGLEPWATWIHLEEAGQIRGSGIMQPTKIGLSGALELTAVGPSGYAAVIPYRDRYSGIAVDPADLVRMMWAHIQGFPRGNLGVTVTGSTPIRIGTEARDVDFVTGAGEIVSFVAGPYQLNYWQNTLIGAEINKLGTETPFDYVEVANWNPTRTGVLQRIDIKYPQAGARRTDLRFTQDENIIEFADVEEPDGAYADTVYVQGKGEGIDAVKGQASLWVGNRLRKPAIVDDKTIDNTARANSKAGEELAARLSALVEIPEIVVDTRHRNAPLGSFSVGDEILPQVRLPYIGLVAVWHRITSIRYLPHLNRAALALTRRGEFRQ